MIIKSSTPFLMIDNCIPQNIESKVRQIAPFDCSAYRNKRLANKLAGNFLLEGVIIHQIDLLTAVTISAWDNERSL